MTQKKHKIDHYYVEESRINLATLESAGSDLTSRLAGGHLSGHSRTQIITPNHHILDATVLDPQSGTATAPSQRSFRNPREPSTPLPLLAPLSKNKVLPTTNVSPGGSVYQLHPTQIGPGLSNQTWSRVAGNGHTPLNPPGLPADFQSTIISELAKKYEKELERKFKRLEQSPAPTRVHPAVDNPSHILRSLGANSSYDTIQSVFFNTKDQTNSPASPPILSKHSRRDAMYLAQAQALTKDSFKWLEETLEAEGIVVDDEPESPELPLTLLTPKDGPVPLLPPPVILRRREKAYTGLELDVGSIQFIDPFAAGPRSRPMADVYLSPHQSPDATPKASFHPCDNSNTAASTGDTAHYPALAPIQGGAPIPVPLESGGLYLASLESAWDGDGLSRYPSFPGGAVGTPVLRTGLISALSTGTVSSTMSYGRIKRSESEPAVFAQTMMAASSVRVRANTVINTRDAITGIFLRHPTGSVTYPKARPVAQFRLEPDFNPCPHSLSEPESHIEGPSLTEQAPLPFANVGNSNWRPPTEWEMPGWEPVEHLRAPCTRTDGGSLLSQSSTSSSPLAEAQQITEAMDPLATPKASESFPSPEHLPEGYACATADNARTGAVTSSHTSVSPKVVKKTRNFSLPTRPSIFSKKNKNSEESNRTCPSSPPLLPLVPLARSLPPFPMTGFPDSDASLSADDISVTHIKQSIPSVDTAVKSSSNWADGLPWFDASPSRSLPGSVTKPLPIISLASTPAVSKGISAAVFSPTNKQDCVAKPLSFSPSSKKTRPNLTLPIGISKPHGKTVPVTPSHGPTPARKSFERVFPTSMKKSLYSKPVFSKSLPHIPAVSKRPSPFPPLPLVPASVSLSTESQAPFDTVYGSVSGTMGSSHVVHPHRKRI